MKIFTEEHRRKLREAHLGKKPGNFGKHYIIKTRIKKFCLKCNNEFEVIPSDKMKKYCSSECFQKSRLTIEEKKERKRLADLKWNKSNKHRKASIEWLRRHLKIKWLCRQCHNELHKRIKNNIKNS